MNLFKKLFFTNREKDYNSISDIRKTVHFMFKRKKIISQMIDRAKWYLGPRFFYIADFPTHVDIETAVSCQMRCPMCQRKGMPKDLQNGIMDFGLYKKIIEECSQRGVYSAKLSWRGEPLLNPQIHNMVKYAKDKGIKDVAFLTNGERLLEETAVNLVEAKLDWISFSIDGVGEIYERIRWPETFAGIVKKVKFLKEYIDKKGLNKPLIRIQTIWGAIKHNPEKYFNLWEKFADKIHIIADQVRWTPGGFEKDLNYICLEPWRRITIGWNGIVPQCISDYEQLNCLGDVKKESLYEIWHGAKFNKLRDSIKNKKLFTNAPCKICHDPGYMFEESIKISNRRIKIGLHKGQSIDVTKIDARPKI